MKLTQELRKIEATPNESQNLKGRDTVIKNLSKMNFRAAGDNTNLQKNANNNVLLSAEEHVLGTEKNGTRYDGLPGCKNTKDPCIFTVDFTQIYGIDFTGTVSIGANATVLFTNCRFAKTVAITSGGKAQFVSPYFYDEGSIQNAGVPANAYLIGSVKKSGVSHTNCTIISEMT